MVVPGDRGLIRCACARAFLSARPHDADDGPSPPHQAAGTGEQGFTPRQVARLNARVADMARQIVDDVVARGECDLVTDVAGALPSYVIAELSASRWKTVADCMS